MTDQEINEAVAIKLGWYRCPPHVWNRKIDDEWIERRPDIPDYCRSIEDAWEIVQKIPYFTLCQNGDGAWRVSWVLRKSRATSFMLADTAPMAICLAFLKMSQGE